VTIRLKISVTNASDNSTETTIPLQKDYKTDSTALEDMEAPTATPSSHKEPRMSKWEKKPPTTKSEDFFMVNNKYNLDNNSFTLYYQSICGLKCKTDELISYMFPTTTPPHPPHTHPMSL
jgi:hypothetical protein